MVLPALLVWDARPDESLAQKQVSTRLLERALHFQTSEFWAPGGPSLCFRSPQSVSMTVVANEATCEALGSQHRGPRPSAAMRALIDEVVHGAIEALELPDGAAPDWLRQLDRAAVGRSQHESVRWVAGLLELHERPAQRRLLLSILAELRASSPSLRRPALGPAADDASYRLTWSYRDRPELTLQIELGPDGDIEWFFRDGDLAEGSEEPLRSLPKRLHALVSRFS